MIIPTYFTVSPQSQIGEVYGTEFVFAANFPYQYNKFAWNFGDRSEIIYNQQTVSHIYNYPGIYTVQLSSWTDAGNFYVEQATINVDYVYRDSVLFTQIPESYGIPSAPAAVPFTVSVTSAKINQPLGLVMQSFNSKSVPRYSIPEKWSFITPTWKFTEVDGTILTNEVLILSTEPIYNSQNKIIAVKAQKSFYYIDDLSTGLDPDKDCPLMIVATLSTDHFNYPPESLIYPYASYSNSEVARAVISWQINDVIPTNLKITDNYINPVFHTKWKNVPIPVLITLDSALQTETGVSNVSSTKAMSYPRTNELGLANEVILSLSSTKFPILSAGIHYKVPEAPLYFKANDEYGNVSSGYLFTTIIPLTSFGDKVVITAKTNVLSRGDTSVSFAFPIGYPIQPNVYVSHPEKNTINRLSVYNSPANCPAIEKYRKLGILVEGALSFVPTVSSSLNYSITGSNVYAMSVNPNINRLYVADIELNTVSYYIQGLNLIKTVNLETLLNKTSLGPSYISVDKNNYVWVSLFDDKAILKFDKDLNYILSAIPIASFHLVVEPQLTEEEYLLVEDEEFLDFEDPTEELPELHPPIVETDRQNDLWVCYPNDALSRLFKFNSNGETILQAGQLPRNSFPVSLSIDANNSVWVACKNTNNLMCFSTDGVLLSTVPGFIRPSYIAHDRFGNISVLHGYDIYSIYNTTTNETSSWRINSIGGEEGKGSIEKITEYTERDLNRLFLEVEDEIWGGLCTDVYNRVWVIDSKYNKIISFKPQSVETFEFKDVLPFENIHKRYYLTADDYNPTVIEEITTDQIRSAQAAGDWSGNRWYQKYGSGDTVASAVSGMSAPFVVRDLDEYYTLAKVNDTFNYAKHFESLSLSDFSKQNLSLFTFLSAAAGDGNPTKESIARVLYEKIANFVSNKSDIETAEVRNLLSIAEELNVNYKEFGSDFPVAVNNLINLFSVHKQRLRGIPNLETDIFKNIGKNLTESDLITADRFYLAKDKKTDKNYLVWSSQYANQAIYPAVYFRSDALRAPIFHNYYLFEYNDSNVNTEIPYVGNLIDWDNQFTTLSYNVSSEEEWYGDGGIVETMFNNLLTKQLFQQ